MSSNKLPRAFTPLDLETIDLVYESAWAQIIAHNHVRDVSKDPERKKALRRKLFAVARPGAVDFDNLLEQVLWMSPETWVFFTKPSRSREVA